MINFKNHLAKKSSNLFLLNCGLKGIIDDPEVPCGIRYTDRPNYKEQPPMNNGVLPIEQPLPNSAVPVGRLLQSKSLDDTSSISDAKASKLITKRKKQLNYVLGQLYRMSDSFDGERSESFRKLVKDSEKILEKDKIAELDLKKRKTVRTADVDKIFLDKVDYLLAKSRNLIEKIQKNLKIKTRASIRSLII